MDNLLYWLSLILGVAFLAGISMYFRNRLDGYLASAKIAAELYMASMPEPTPEQRRPLCDSYKKLKDDFSIFDSTAQEVALDEILDILKCDELET